MPRSVSKSQFKPHSLEYFRKVEQTGEELVITDHGRLVPYYADPEECFQGLRNTVLKFDAPLEPISDSKDTVSFHEAFPEYQGNEARMALNGYRSREGLTQEQLAQLTGISRRHISEMEHGKRPVGKESARKLAAALHCDYRRLL